MSIRAIVCFGLASVLAIGCTDLECDPEAMEVDGRCVCRAGFMPVGDRCESTTDTGMTDGGPDTGDTDAGTDAPMACGGACTGAMPHCDTDTDTCVACLDDSHCDEMAPVCSAGGVCGPCTGPADCAAYPDTPVCGDSGAVDGTCVGCAGDSDCTDADAGKCDTSTNTCVPCDDSDQCTEDGAGVCDMSGESGLCVECNADDETACGDNVCDVAAMTCTETPAEMTGLCGECVSDRQCSPGRVCVPMTYTDLDTPETSVGNFCLWREDADAPVGAPGGSCPSVRPYFPTVEAVTVSGETVDVCSLAVSTCPALEDFRMTPCTTPGVSDATCGTGLGDGLCRNVSGDTNRCTVRCDSDDDCRSTTCNTGESPPYCNF